MNFIYKENGRHKINSKNILRFEKVSTMVGENEGVQKTYIFYHPIRISIDNRESADIAVIEERLPSKGTVIGEEIRDLVRRVRALNLSDIKKEGNDIFLDLKNAKMCTNMSWQGKIKVDLLE